MEEVAILVLTYCLIKSRSIKNYYIKKNVVDLVSHTGENKEALSRAKTKRKRGISMKRREQKGQKHHCSYLSRIAAVF